MRYVIVGAGAVGVSLAVELSGRGHDVRVIARGETLRYFARNPVAYRTASGTRTVSLPVAAISDDLGLAVGDILVLASKTQDTRDIAQELAWRDVRDRQGTVVGVAADHIPIVTPQNGLDAERAAARWFATVIGATVLISASYVRLGEVRVGGHPYVGSVLAGLATSAGAAGERALHALTEDLRAAGFWTETVPDIGAYKAAKILHSVKNGLEVLAGDRLTKEAVGAALVAEARGVLAAAGIAHHEPSDLLPSSVQRSFSTQAGVVPGRQSTWQSFARAAPTNEVDYLNGEIALLARLHHVAAPLNTCLQQLLGRATRSGGGLELPGLDTLTDLMASGPRAGETA
ncbi:2-dehydropantoate 2-reductase N-terminal domain-containing protein [Nocardia sp. R7R-8]|uniref:2-dehydropantoate 2-reductase N-terminal domain-containing protein n=1 Tax=Nocardia sp. R7R-8 TaxID=3459304 RepID=UPI00403D8345